MFLRSTAKKVKGKTYRYWKLVENVRTERGVRQRVVAHLGVEGVKAFGRYRALKTQPRPAGS
ncbi:hypothetical protein [Candidatus Hakubella thermalkaliphila]|uniref:hypothetical protein n=1 Tax=Candidatus Hakubella thermalkaliphila TaxID=2754717 RepID=UPI001594C0B0|nr:hypothetical protein [Candidatus Hakubella thermalkaliphila]